MRCLWVLIILGIGLVGGENSGDVIQGVLSGEEAGRTKRIC